MSFTVNVSKPVAADVSELERRTLFKVKLYMYAYFLAGMIFLRLDAFNISFAQLTMGKELAISATIFGLTAGIYSVSAFFAQVPSGLLFDKFGARRWMTAIMIGWGVSCAAQAFVHSKWQLLALRFCIGVFEAGFLPGLFILVNIWFKDRDHGVPVSFTQIGAAAAGIVGSPFAGWILGHAIFGLSGWRNLFLFEGGMTVIFSLLALLIVSDDPNTARWLKPHEREFMVKYLAENQAEKASRGAIEKTSFWDTLKDYRILMLAFSIFCSGWSASTFLYFLPILLKAAGRGLNNQAVGFLAVIPAIVSMLVSYGWAAHADKHNERHWHAVSAILVAVAGMMLYPLAKTPAVALLALVLVNAGNSGVFVNFWATCTIVVGRKTVAKSTAIIQSGAALGTFFGPLAFGWMMDFTGAKTVGLYMCVVVMALNFVVLNIFFFKHKAQQKAAAATVRLARKLGEKLPLTTD